MHESLIVAPRQPIAIIRLDDLSSAVQIAEALIAGGLRALEFTLTNRDALQAIEQVRAEVGPAAYVGAGTVLTAADAQAAIDAGAQFLVTPTLEPDVIAAGHKAGAPTISGAWTPTEILTAWRHGAALVKVFPARTLGPAYIRDVLAPLPMLRLVPTGGVSLENCAAFLQAGAYTVALGSNLVEPGMVGKKDWAALVALARSYVEACHQAGVRSTQAA
jgi:2-dehydro-3-deoxyphosphogluconate aldolase / (4S)-4-hydroxy-2-oxoglutarate aldolase